MSDAAYPAREVVRLLRQQRLTVACAESLTGGLLCAALTEVPGASAAVRGGVVAYATELKAMLLGVDARLLSTRGAVDPDVAKQMAAGVRTTLRADLGVATTGVAGPEPQDQQPVGTVYVAVAGSSSSRVVALRLCGDRAEIREQTVAAALHLLRSSLAVEEDAP